MHRLAGETVTVREGIRLPLPPLAEHVANIRDLASSVDIVLVEGSGGLLAELIAAGQTLADLCAAVDGELVLVARPDLGTLNHTMLTLEAAHARGLRMAGLLLGSWPDEAGVVHVTNEAYLQGQCATSSTPWLGRIPEQAGSLPGLRFRAEAVGWLSLAVTAAS